MIRVRGFDKAKQLMARQISWEPLNTSMRQIPGTEKDNGIELSVSGVVNLIIDDVRDKGDQALLDYTRKLDGAKLVCLEVNKQETAAAYKSTDKRLVQALELAARRIQEFHEACGYKDGVSFVSKQLKQKARPLDRVGLYIPGGTAAYPSTVLMMAIPARVAGVKEIIMVSPPGKDGEIPAATLIAADIAQITRIFKVGGAQAIAALAFGTESIPRVDKICGPGNIFVTLAKKAVYGTVAIDGLEGPSEIVIIADEKADPVICAADILAQAEHDAMASVNLITTSVELIKQVDKEIKLQLGQLKRKSITARAIEAGLLVLVKEIDEAVELVNLFAPEHLSLMVANASTLIPKIRNAGCIFIGEYSPVAMGDYIAGPSHVLPTGGSARFSSPLGVDDFLKVTNIIELDKSTMQELSAPALLIAEVEGLNAHAQAIEKRIKDN